MTHPTAALETAPVLAHEAHGPVAGLPVVLLHGFPFDRRIWDETSRLLGHAGFRVVAVDLPGFGDSPLPSHHRSMADMADDVAALLDRLGHPKAVVLGFSMGGYAALEFALRHADRMSGLVLVSTRAEPDSIENRAGRLDLAEKVLKDGTRPLKDAMLPRLLPKRTQLERRGLVRDVALWFDRASPEAVAKTLLALADRRDLRSHLAEVKAPTLVVVGAEDETMGTAPSEHLAQSIPGATLVKLPGCGHLPMLEDGPGFRRAVTGFLAELGVGKP